MKILIIDIDEVLADAYGGLLAWYYRDYGEMLTPDQIKGKKVRYAVPEDRFEPVRQYLYTEGFFRTLPVIEGAVEAVKLLNDKYQLYVASSALEFPQSLHEKYDWMKEHFPFIHWKQIILCGDKKALKGDIMIDDHAHNLESFDGEIKLLFSSPHNVFEERFTRVNNWNDVAEILL